MGQAQVEQLQLAIHSLEEAVENFLDSQSIPQPLAEITSGYSCLLWYEEEKRIEKSFIGMHLSCAVCGTLVVPKITLVPSTKSMQEFETVREIVFVQAQKRRGPCEPLTWFYAVCENEACEDVVWRWELKLQEKGEIQWQHLRQARNLLKQARTLLRNQNRSLSLRTE